MIIPAHLLKRFTRPRGVAIVEFALILPLIVTILLGMIDASLALYDKAVLTNASREAVRYGVVLRSTPASEQEIRTQALNYCEKNLVSFDSKSTPSVQTYILSDPKRLKVVVSYPFSGHSVGKIYTALAGPITISSSAVMSYE